MPRETMTPRERWLAVLQRKQPDRVPMDYWATAEVTERLQKELGAATEREMLKKLHVDYLVFVGPRYAGPTLPPDTDVFGCRSAKVQYETGVYSEIVYSPLAQYNTVEEVERDFTWPDPDWWDYSHVPEQLVGQEAYATIGGGSQPFLTYKRMRGMEQAFVDLALNPEFVHYCLDKLFSFEYERTRRLYETIPGRVTVSYVDEDLGGQTGLMYSPGQIREFLLPWMKRMVDLAHQAGAYVRHHDDGNCRPILPELVDLGIDILNPIQWRCPGMEREGLKRDFGDRLMFHGAMDNQYTLPFGTVEEVRQEVRDNLRILGAGGGYVLAPCHNIQAVSPTANILAMYETGFNEGWA